MSCEAVAQGMRMDFLVDPRPLCSLLAGIPHYLGGDGMIGGVPGLPLPAIATLLSRSINGTFAIVLGLEFAV